MQQLAEGGITDINLINQLGIYSMTATELSGILQRRDMKSGGLVFEYPYIDGYKRVRLDKPIYRTGESDGYNAGGDELREIRYLSKKGQGNHLYLPLPEGEFKSSSRLYVTEGEKKSIALIQVGCSAVGVSGVWSWRTTGGICAEFELLNWRRRVTVVFDSDGRHIKNVRAASLALARQLTNLGASVEICLMPKSKEG